MHKPTTLNRLWASALTALALASALACGGGSGGSPPAAPAGAGGGAGAGEPVAPISSRGTPAGAGSPTAAATGSIAWDLPATWQQEPPSSGMRMAQALIPGAGGVGGVGDEGQLVVFHFGPGGGGGVEANLARWVEQMDVKPGTEPQRQVFAVRGYQVTLLDVAGTLKPSGMGMGPATPQPDSVLLAAVVEGPGGPWFFKATGPEATMAAARADFRAMLESVRAAE